MELHRYGTSEEWLSALEQNWKRAGGAALEARGQFTVSFSGGSTPKPFYEHLAKNAEWPWSSTLMYIGDERSVPMDHKDSNYKMIFEAFYPRKVKLEKWQADHPDSEYVARDYAKKMSSVVGDPPRFDIMMLGLGDDGHTASLFPDTLALDETEKWAVANLVPKLHTTRYTFTYPLIHNSREIWFLVKGDSKRAWVEKMVKGDTSFPAGRVTCREEDPSAIKIFFLE
jgi:6-phosphogluconolactonase